jgi:hypothetical protein
MFDWTSCWGIGEIDKLDLVRRDQAALIRNVFLCAIRPAVVLLLNDHASRSCGCRRSLSKCLRDRGCRSNHKLVQNDTSPGESSSRRQQQLAYN